MTAAKLKPRKNSEIKLIDKYHNNEAACIDFFYRAKWPQGFYCEKCGCTHYYFNASRRLYQCSDCGHQNYLFSNTVFQDNKLPLFKLILGLYHLFVANKGISAEDLANILDVNRKTAQLLCRKCRTLMSDSVSSHKMYSRYFEMDAFYIGSRTPKQQGKSSNKQCVLISLSTDADGEYPRYIRMRPVPCETKEHIRKFAESSMILDKIMIDDKLVKSVLNTDGSQSYSILNDVMDVNNEKIVYEEDDHRLKWINIIIGNIKTQIGGIYHGVTRRCLPLYLNEQTWRFNHRRSGSNIMDKIQKYIGQSQPRTRKMISRIEHISEPYFTSADLVNS